MLRSGRRRLVQARRVISIAGLHGEQEEPRQPLRHPSDETPQEEQDRQRRDLHGDDANVGHQRLQRLHLDLQLSIHQRRKEHQHLRLLRERLHAGMVGAPGRSSVRRFLLSEQRLFGRSQRRLREHGRVQPDRSGRSGESGILQVRLLP